MSDETLRRAVAELRAKAVARFDEFGPTDVRGAAIWDCASWLSEEFDRDALERYVKEDDK